MSEEGIAPDASSVEKGGDRREFKGKKGDLDVTIELERKSPTRTRVESAATLRRSSQEPARALQSSQPSA